MVLEDKLYQSDNATGIHDIVYTPDQIVLDSTSNNRRTFPYAHIVTRNDKEVGGTQNGQPITQTVTTYTFDPTGNATTVATSVTDQDATSPYSGNQWSTSTTSTITADTGANWCLTLPSQVQTTNSAPGVPSTTRTIQFPAPDYVKCRQQTLIVEPNSSAYKVTEGFTFDAFGNVYTDTITGVGMTGRTWTTTWGTTGQFPSIVSDPMPNHNQTQRGYSASFGVQTSETDPNAIQVFSRQLDGFGRAIQENNADGTYTKWTYKLCSDYPGVCPADADLRYWVQQIAYDSTGVAVHETRNVFNNLEQLRYQLDQNLDGSFVYRLHRTYDLLGNIKNDYVPGTDGNAAYHLISYDSVNRKTADTLYVAGVANRQTTWAYAGRTTTTTDPYAKSTTTVTTVAGTLGRTTDNSGYYLSYVYDAFGSLLSVTDSLSMTALSNASYQYGIHAFRTTSSDEDLGSWQYSYNALGEPSSYTDAKLQTVTFDPFDALGRPTKRTEPDLTTTWTWGTLAANYEIGRLTGLSTSGGTAYSETLTYNNKGQLTNDTIQGQPFDVTYNAQGRPDTLTYPTSTSSTRFKLQYQYQNGFLKQITDVNASQALWVANQMNAWGAVANETLGAGVSAVVVNRILDATTGALNSAQAGVGGGTGLLNQSYLYDLVGNVTQRQNNTLGLTESFCYDALYRLDHSTLTGLCTSNANLQLTYDAMGNIRSRNDIAGGAQWTYSSAHRHQVLQAGDSAHAYTYDANGNAATRNGYTLGWTSYNLPSSVAASGESSAFNYGPRHELWQQTYSGPSGSETTSYYGRLLEKVVNGGGTDYRHYVYANGELVAVYSRTSSGTNTLRFVLNDHEQSPAVVVNSSGVSVVSESFAAFGTRRNPITWSGAPSPGDLSIIASISRVGYTGQTMIGETGLIHMRGRVQDAVTGRFLSADPGGIDPALTQTFDRYSYVINNPITLVDPSGYELCADIYFPPVGKQPDTAGSDAIVIGHTGPLHICIHGLGDSRDRNSNNGNRDNTKKDPNQPQKNPCPVQPLSANNLDPRVQAKADDLLARLADDNIIARIGQTLRSFAQQNRLYAQGRTMPGSIVTNARGGDSLHNFGLAFDIQLFDGGGTYITNGTDSAYTTAGYEGMSLNLEWGGQWSKPVDPSHFQFTDGLTLNQVQANSNAGRDVLCHAP